MTLTVHAAVVVLVGSKAGSHAPPEQEPTTLVVLLPDTQAPDEVEDDHFPGYAES